VGLIPSATFDYAALTPRWNRSPICQISIHSRGLHLCRCIHAFDCPALHQYVGGRIHVAVMWILPSQSAPNRSVGYPNHMIRGAPYRFIYHLTDFFEGRDIQSGDQLVVKLVLVRRKHEYSSGTFLTISTSPAMLSSLSLSRSIAVWKVNFQVRVVCNVVMIRHTRLKFTLTLTRPCQFARLALPAFKAERIRGIFLIPPSWLCIIFEMSRFSELVKHSTALWRAFMTSRDSEGRRSHVRRSERPSVVLVLSSVPNVSRQTKCSNAWGWNADRIVIIPPWFS
jgi:hypothetical protein